jgi:hypothetical protein
MMEIFTELLPSAVCSQYILQTVWTLFIFQTVGSKSIHTSWPLIPGLSIIKVLSDITQIHVVDAARSKYWVHSGVDGDTPDIIDEEGTIANVTDGIERAAVVGI